MTQDICVSHSYLVFLCIIHYELNAILYVSSDLISELCLVDYLLSSGPLYILVVRRFVVEHKSHVFLSTCFFIVFR